MSYLRKQSAIGLVANGRHLSLSCISIDDGKADHDVRTHILPDAEGKQLVTVVTCVSWRTAPCRRFMSVPIHTLAMVVASGHRLTSLAVTKKTHTITTPPPCKAIYVRQIVARNVLILVQDKPLHVADITVSLLFIVESFELRSYHFNPIKLENCVAGI